MIYSCKYCLNQKHLCPRCTGEVVVRTLNDYTKDGHPVSGTFILCSDPSCDSYGVFATETVGSIVPICCDECKKTHPNHEEELNMMAGGFRALD